MFCFLHLFCLTISQSLRTLLYQLYFCFSKVSVPMEADLVVDLVADMEDLAILDLVALVASEVLSSTLRNIRLANNHTSCQLLMSPLLSVSRMMQVTLCTPSSALVLTHCLGL